MAHAFISHSKFDKEFAHRIAALLRSKDVKVWIAPDSILPGEEWVDAIEHGLQVATHLLLIESPDSVNSKWVQQEMRTGVALATEGKLKIIAIKFRPTNNIPLFWNNYQGIRFTGDFQNLEQQLMEALALPASPPQVRTDDPDLDITVISELLDFATDKFLSGQTPTTRLNYERRLQDFLTWTQGRTYKSLYDQLNDYRDYLQVERNLNPRTVRAYVLTVRAMFETAAGMDRRLASDVLRLRHMKLPEIMPRETSSRLTSEDIERLIAAPDLTTLRGQRDVCILGLIKLGLPIRQISDLRWSDIVKQDEASVLIRSNQNLVLSPTVAGTLEHWKTTLALSNTDPIHHIFCPITKDGRLLWRKYLGAQGINKIVDNYAKSVGLPGVNTRDIRRIMKSGEAT